MATAWFQCQAGASGDMLLGALLDAGAPLEAVQEAVDAVGVEPIMISAERTERHGIAATYAKVKTVESHMHRTWNDVRDLLDRADLPEPVHARAHDVFGRLAHAEARAHRCLPEEVHFHEVGALDAIADVVGTCTALHALGVQDAIGSPVALGNGSVEAAHGRLPVPAPAVLELMRVAAAPVYSGPAPYEMCTPTGAALLTSVCGSWGPMPALRITADGTGAGSRRVDEVPNILRVVLGEPYVAHAAQSTLCGDVLIETNVDDLDPRLWPAVLGKLLAGGAADAWLVPILMKKGRPAHTLCVLVSADRLDDALDTVFRETSTIGARMVAVAKRALDRDFATVSVEGLPIRVKTATFEGKVVNAQPEYEDVAAAAESLGRPVKVVMGAAAAAAYAAGMAP
ncbi:nickel pincer cofactor biosynthesis protein LarC [Streptomyces sp. SID3343]|uniref:nickel pincer cofactor biosynthesis protein LarC n=1 Tax=Streptomyces sp. SID3343 TaxID=2690260 RepID=UPI001F1DC480|nr:nickel pincer cofactor biosynthesis protein LarC [Streptomyces sp. SID3343]